MTAQTISGSAEPYRIKPGALLRAASDAIPPSGLLLLAILSVQLGAGLAKNLFTQLPPAAVVFLRMGEKILLSIEELREAVVNASEHPSGDVSLGVPPSWSGICCTCSPDPHPTDNQRMLPERDV